MKEPAIVLYTMPEVAMQLRVSRRWLQDFIKVNPFYRMAGRRKVFSPDDIRSLYEAMPRPTAPRVLVRQQRPRSWTPPPKQPGWKEVLAKLQAEAVREKAEKQARRLEEQAKKRAERLKAKEPRERARTGRKTP